MNKPKIGLIQPGGIGDIVIALPIGKHFVDNGFEVFHPIHKNYLESFSTVAPYINFISLENTNTIQDAILDPMRILSDLGCVKAINLLSYISPNQELVENKKFAECFKFDQYKYSISGVPFRKKWDLQLIRNKVREEALFEKLGLNLNDEYTVLHIKGAKFEVNIDSISSLISTSKFIQITNETSNLFDWLTVLERAKHLIMIDSCYANIVEQLNFSNPKTLVLSNPIAFTPVFINNWNYVYFNQ